MPVSSELEKQLKKATKTGKYVVGRKEVLASLKGSKLLVWSASANISQEILKQSKSFQIPALRFDGDPIALGKVCGIPFKVSVIAVKSAGDADLNLLSGSQDYAVPASVPLTQVPVSQAEIAAAQNEDQANKNESMGPKKPKEKESREEGKSEKLSASKEPGRKKPKKSSKA